jgi:hypothetical protein
LARCIVLEQRGNRRVHFGKMDGELEELLREGAGHQAARYSGACAGGGPARQLLHSGCLVLAPASAAHPLQRRGQLVQWRLGQRLRRAGGAEQLEDRRLTEVGVTGPAGEAGEEADERGEEHHQRVMQPLACGAARRHQVPAGARARARARAQRRDGLRRQHASAPGRSPTAAC